MDLASPYLIRDTGGVASVTSDVETESMELTVRGQWSRTLAAEVRSGIHKCVAEHPAAVLIDLRRLSDPRGVSVPMWLAAYRAGSVPQPPVRVVLCVPPATVLAERLHNVGADQYLPRFAVMAEARTSLGASVPLADRLQLTLPPELTSAALARDLIAQACTAWHLTRLLYPARLVLSELVMNAIEHAGTPMIVTGSRRGTGLYVSVRDGDVRMPYLRDLRPPAGPAPLDERGLGLRLVHGAASAWGARELAGGKLVWATVRKGRGAAR